MIAFFRKRLFWVLQLVGWGSISLIIVFTGSYDSDSMKPMALFLPMTVLGILSSTFLRWVLKTKAAKYEWGLKKVFAITLANILGAILLFSFFILVFLIKTSVGINGKTDNPSEFDSIFPVTAGAISVVAFGLFFWTIFYYGIKYLITYNNERVRRLLLKEAVKSAQLKTLKGHLHPQFLVSSLKNIKGLMSVNVTEARAVLTALSELLRYSLTKNDETPVTISNEIEMVQRYRQILAIDSTTAFSIDIKIPNEISTYAIPPMILLHLIILVSTNSISLSAEKKIDIIIIEIDSDIRIAIRFNGEMKQETETKAIENILKQRLFLLYGRASNYTLNCTEEITSVVVSIPSKVNSELNTAYGNN